MTGLFRVLTAGESHGEALVAVIDGIPARLPLTEGQHQRGPGAPPALQPENLVALLRR
ncbi:MAG: hypothetical protein DMD95_10560 [Candidatus Rokuibacteriota bacterium]|nr:MAG: hypothetical protein DMD95_10560 [Candidatus Rokubacteria bacterium]